MNPSESKNKDRKLVFLQKSTCAETLFYVINQEFNNNLKLEEKASGALAGKIVKTGHQCGQLWGATLAVGAEAYHEGDDSNESIFLAINTSKAMANSYETISSSSNIYELKNTDIISKSSSIKYFLRGESLKCYKLADKWAPEAIKIAKTNLQREHIKRRIPCSSCATRVVREMGGSENDAIMVAGFAGGIGLSGNACGALAAAIWYDALKWLREHPDKKYFPIKLSDHKIHSFLNLTKGEYLCPELSGKTFDNVEEHSDFILEGGCNKLIDILAEV